ncbi:MAG: zf-HC2 domain-containing protein, partial [Armatimonadota bacterium]|nr:zf-HC2 domain-containing protein [Armatimonadota bacterium]
AYAEPAPDFTCARMQVWMSARLDGELTLHQTQELTQHLQSCPACALEWQAMEAVSGVLRALPEVEPPLGLERSIRVEIARRQRGVLARLGGDWFRLPRLAPGLAPVAAAAMLAVGFWLGRAFPPGPATEPTAATARVYQGAHTAPKIEAAVRAPGPQSEVGRTPRVARDPGISPAPAVVAPERTGVQRPQPQPRPVVAERRPAEAHPSAPEPAPETTHVAREESAPAVPPTRPASAAPEPRPEAVATAPEPAPVAPPVGTTTRSETVSEVASLLTEAQEPDTPRIHREEWWRKDRRDLLADATAALTSKPPLRTRSLTATVLRADFQ